MTFIVHGIVGLVVLSHGNVIIRFLENNALVNRIYKKVQTFENFINEGLQFNTRKPAISCRGLFAG